MNASADPLQIFVGYDAREHAAWRVCHASLRRHAGAKLHITPLVTDALRESGFYTRADDGAASTAFSFTRFLVPHLMGYEGWALFCDCDFLFRRDVAQLFALADPSCAVMCVPHDHRPQETLKMDGQRQVAYPRKNWSSLVLWNCGHEANRAVTPTLVAKAASPFLHRFGWLEDREIGALPETWNWLVNVSPTTPSGAALDPGDVAAVHFTLGGPWFDGYEDVPFAGEWRDAHEAALVDAGRPALAGG